MPCEGLQHFSSVLSWDMFETGIVLRGGMPQSELDYCDHVPGYLPRIDFVCEKCDNAKVKAVKALAGDQMARTKTKGIFKWTELMKVKRKQPLVSLIGRLLL